MANDKKKMVEAITAQEVDFAQWYTDICTKAELVEYSSVKGFVVLRPYGFAIWETLYSLVLEVVFAYVIGLPLGVLLVTGEKGGVKPLRRSVMRVFNVVINLLRSVPFLILMIICLPLSKFLVGTKAW